MKKRLSCVLVFVLSVTSLLALDTNDRNAIDTIVEHYTHAWNDCEGRGFGHYYAQDADFVNIFGMAFSGKQEIEDRHIKILETFLKGSRFEVIETKVREVKPDVVIAQVYWKVTNIQKPGAETMKGIFTHTFLKSNDTWEIAAAQNTLIAP
jgi:uncharacterized protein (TIGR02246 family)